MKFAQLGLAEPILRAVAAEGYDVPTPIQLQAIPHVLAGSDMFGCAQTGTGKTAAFALPILDRLAARLQHAAHDSHTASQPHHHNGHSHRGHAKPQATGGPHNKADRRPTRALILCPTRELASQIGESFRAYGRFLPVRHVVVFGGVSQHHQVKALQTGVDILIATPGRLLDLMQQGFVDLRQVKVLVLDEADRMLDMGFIHDIRRIVKVVPPSGVGGRQTLLFSATMPHEIRDLAATILNNPVSITVTPVSSTVETVSQSVYHVQRNLKSALLAHVLKRDGVERTLVFTRTKHGADKVVRNLNNAGIRAEAIHGNKSQNARTRALQAFKSKTPPVLVATDIASRGIDVDGITHVINFDIPHEPETYVHRIGRTARAGASGVAISFCDAEERGDLKAIERLTRVAITVKHDMPALAAPQPAPRPAPHAGAGHPNGHRAGGHHKPGGQRHDSGAPGQRQRGHTAHSGHSRQKPVAHAPKKQSFGQRGRGRGRAGSGRAW